VYRIGEFSNISRVPVSAIRYYSDLGLLPPVTVDSSSGYRYYEAGQLPRLNRILALKDLGLSLDEIGSILNDELSAEELRGMLRLKQAEMSRAVAEQQAQLARVESRLRLIESEEMSDYEIVLKDLDAQHVLSLREIAEEPSHVGTMIGDGFSALMPAGIMPTAPCFSVYHDPEFKPDHIDVEIAYPVPPGTREAPQTPGGRTFSHRIVPGGRMAVTVHQGPYDTIDQAYAALGVWLEENNLKMSGPPQEAYLTAPDDPGGPVSEIRIPVE
jgi:DNA-binding transcriptional MerR regulator